MLGGINAVIVELPHHTGRPARPTWNCSTICRCRSRRSTQACRYWEAMVRDLPAPLGAGATTSTPGPGGTSVSPPPVGVAASVLAECGRRMVVQVRPDGCGPSVPGTAGWTPPTWKRGDERAPFG
ncbi:hypothetical protein I552_0015 [Mycobacterium xenopi 3993]|nr:hypothetical protein I552_0015 [Mycobacterium xenopi 3993]